MTHADYVHLHLSAYSCSYSCRLHTYTCMRHIHIRRTQLTHELTHQRTCSCAYARRFWSPPAPRLPLHVRCNNCQLWQKTDTNYNRICSMCIYVHAHAMHTCSFPQRLPLLCIAAGIHVFTCCIIADQLLLCKYIYASGLCRHTSTASTFTHFIIYSCNVGMHAHLNAIHTCS